MFAANIGQKSSVAAILNTIKSGRVKPLNLGRISCGGKAVAALSVMASIGYDAHVVHTVNLGMKKWVGRLAYVLAALKVFCRFEPRTFTIIIDDMQYECEGVVLSNGRYYGGTFICAPDACVTALGIDACLIRLRGRRSLLKFAGALVTNRVSHLANVQIVRGKHFAIDAHGLPVQIDGDPAGHTPIIVDSVIAKHVNLLVP